VVDPDAADGAGFSDAAVERDPSDPFVFAARRRPSLVSGYIQDVFEPSGRVTLNYGVRVDASRMLIRAHQWSPRLAASYRAGSGTIVRASLQRLFQPPQAEYLLLGSSEQARALSPFVEESEGGGAEIPPERTTALEGSISHTAAGWRFHASAWRRRVRDAGDPNVFFGTTVTIPNSVARQHARGVELRLDLLPRRGWSASATYTHARVDQFGPITGGLFLEDEYIEVREGTRFTPDHDQRHALAASATYAADGRRWRVSGAWRYQTGTPLGVDDDDLDDLRDARGAGVADFETGRVRARSVADLQAEWRFRRAGRADLSLTAWVTNLTNQTYAYNFGNPFSGTHFGAPRRAGLSLAARFGGTRP
jgi:outer membrane receptor protein involved in Fe transport